MKKLLTILAAFLVVTLGAGFAIGVENGSVEVNLSGTKEITPNAFQLTFAVETTNLNMEKAVSENKKNSEVLYKTLKSMINTSRGDYLKTSSYSVYPEYNYTKGVRNLTGYKVQNSVVVYVKDIDVVSKFADVASTKGVTRVDSLTFKSTNYENECNELLAELTNKAKNRANASVKPLGLQVLALKTLSTSCSDSPSYPVANYAMKANTLSVADEAGGASTPIQSGKIILKANINSSFYVGKK